ncbi:hypothetical protein BDV97DRAFT_366810 [Delphinella strobiligena]|nr:hypothetical protein BDV97DRAFT_366810 [Delphinella strobiligena]
MVLHSILKKGVTHNKINMNSEDKFQSASNTQQPVVDLSGLRAQILDNAATVFDNPKTYFPTPTVNRNGCKTNPPASSFHIRIVVKAKTLRTTTHPWYLTRAVLVHNQVPGTVVVLFGGAYHLTLHKALAVLVDKSVRWLKSVRMLLRREQVLLDFLR